MSNLDADLLITYLQPYNYEQELCLSYNYPGKNEETQKRR